MSRPCTAKAIVQFSKDYQVNMEEVGQPLEQYNTLNEFFSRHLKNGVRPVANAENPSVAVSSADSKVMVFDTVMEATSLWIKGKHFTVDKLLGSRYDAAAWDGCAIIINRLSPGDYHRLHAPVTGSLRHIAHAGSMLYAVEAVAISSPLDVYTKNERAILEFETSSFGTVIMCAIGASQVGSIQTSVEEGQQICKGVEVATFKYGGSAVLTLFKRDRIKWDTDLRNNSQKLWETKVKMGPRRPVSDQKRTPRYLNSSTCSSSPVVQVPSELKAPASGQARRRNCSSPSMNRPNKCRDGCGSVVCGWWLALTARHLMSSKLAERYVKD
ncbi:g1231 [Coccomyxa elongata]